MRRGLSHKLRVLGLTAVIASPALWAQADLPAALKVRMSAPVPMAMAASSQGKITEMGIFAHPVASGASNFSVSPSLLTTPNALDPKQTAGELFADDAWGIGNLENLVCTDAADPVIQAINLNFSMVKSVSDVVFADALPEGMTPDEIAKVHTLFQGLCSNEPEPVPVVEEVVLADVRMADASAVTFSGEHVTPYASGFPRGYGRMLHGALVREGVSAYGMIGVFNNITQYADLIKNDPVGGALLGLLKNPGVTPNLLYFRFALQGSGKVLVPHALSGGLFEPPVVDGALPQCFPFVAKAGEAFDKAVPLDAAALLQKGCAGELDPVGVATLNLFGTDFNGDPANDIVVINRGALADGHVGYVTIYQHQGFFPAAQHFHEEWRYRGFLPIGAEPYGYSVLRDLVDGQPEESLIIASAAAEPDKNIFPHQYFAYQIHVANGLVHVEKIPLTEPIPSDSEIAPYFPYDIVTGDFNTDGLGDFLVTWIAQLYDKSKPIRFAPFFHVYFGLGDHQFTPPQIYTAPAVTEDAEQLVEAGGEVKSAMPQLITGAECDLDRDGIMDLCIGDQHPRFVKGERQAFVYYYRGLGGGVFDNILVPQYRVNTRIDYMPEPAVGLGGVKQVEVDAFQNLFVLLGVPILNDVTEIVVPPEQCVDIDGDEIGEGFGCPDNCPNLPNPKQEDADLDGDGDACDNCPQFSNPNQKNQDNDEFGDACDNCIKSKNGAKEGQLDGAGEQLDGDKDGVGNVCDNCPIKSNPLQTDADADAVGDACDNCDPADAAVLLCDAEVANCANPDQADGDKDGIGDVCDNCIEKSNANQTDLDFDLVGDACDNCDPTKWCVGDVAACKNQNQQELDGDGVGEACDNCSPNDFACAPVAICANANQTDDDKDGIGNSCEPIPPVEKDEIICLDLDNDGFPDGVEMVNGVPFEEFVKNLDLGDPKAVELWGKAIKKCFLDNCNPIDTKLFICPDVPPDFGDPADCQACADAPTLCANGSAQSQVADGKQLDADGDLVGNLCDNCPNQKNFIQKDVDGDGHGDACDNCKLTFNPSQADSNGNKIGDTCEVWCPDGDNPFGTIADGFLVEGNDPDGDGIPNANFDKGVQCDNCLLIKNPDQADVDDDGIGNACDLCASLGKSIFFANINDPNTLKSAQQIDKDKDGVGDACDNCPDVANSPNADGLQPDFDLDGLGDACDRCKNDSGPIFIDYSFSPVPKDADSDSDGVPNHCDNCPTVSNVNQLNSDKDSFGNACDNCALVTNPGQTDGDKDEIGDLCDTEPCGTGTAAQKKQCCQALVAVTGDQDSDGFANGCDNCQAKPNPLQGDGDADGFGDKCDSDPCEDVGVALVIQCCDQLDDTDSNKSACCNLIKDATLKGQCIDEIFGP